MDPACPIELSEPNTDFLPTSMESNIAFMWATAGASCTFSKESVFSRDVPDCDGFLVIFRPGFGGDLEGFGLRPLESDNWSVTKPADFTLCNSGLMEDSSLDLPPNLGMGFLFLAKGKVTSSDPEDPFSNFCDSPVFFS